MKILVAAKLKQLIRLSCSQDTFYVGIVKGVGRIYQQTFVDTYSKVVQCKLYTTKTLSHQLIY